MCAYVLSILVVYYLILVCFVLAFVLGWNNSGLTTGSLSNLVTYNAAVVLALTGIFAGFVLEGSKMTQSVLGKLIPSALGTYTILTGAIIALIFFLLLTVAKIPVSLSNCVVGSFVGVALATKAASISSATLIEIVASWLIAPFFCMGVAIFVYVIATRSERSLSLPKASWINRLVLFAAVFYVAYALGANNVGLIFSFILHATPPLPIGGEQELLIIGSALYFGIALGTLLFGKSIAKVLGESIVALSQIKTLSAVLAAASVILILTELAIPVSLTQVVVGGMLGAGSARGPTVVNTHELVVMIRRWVILTLTCAVAGFVAQFALSMA